MPQDYDEKYRKWLLEDLPIIPGEWKYRVTSSTRKQFNILEKLMKRKVASPSLSKQILFIYFSSLWVGGTQRLDSILFIRVLDSVQHFFPASLQ